MKLEDKRHKSRQRMRELRSKQTAQEKTLEKMKNRERMRRYRHDRRSHISTVTSIHANVNFGGRQFRGIPPVSRETLFNPHRDSFIDVEQVSSANVPLLQPVQSRPSVYFPVTHPINATLPTLPSAHPPPVSDTQGVHGINSVISEFNIPAHASFVSDSSTHAN